MRAKFLFSLIVLAGTLVLGCSGGTVLSGPLLPPADGTQAVVVKLAPKSVTLSSQQNASFVASGQTASGQSVSPAVVWNATGGTISNSGLFLAGSSAGSYRVIASLADGSAADTAQVVIASAPAPSEGTLAFRSGFGGQTRIVPQSPIVDDIVGSDGTVSGPSDWTANLDNQNNFGTFEFYYEAGDSLQRNARLVADPVNPQNRVLRFWLPAVNVPAKGKARVQADLYRGRDLREFYQSVRFFLPADMAELRNFPGTNSWLTFAEFWNNNTWGDAYPFRVSLNLTKPSAAVGSGLYFGVRGQTYDASTSSYTTLWNSVDNSFAVPVETWVTMELYFKEGNASSGRFYLAVTPDGGARRVLCDIIAPTYHPSDPAPGGLNDFNPLKLYTSASIINFMSSRGKVLQVYWDDFELWTNRRP